MALNPKPRKISVQINDNYCMKLDTEREHCALERPHWHLFKNGVQVAGIYTTCAWMKLPRGIEPEILNKVVEITSKRSVELCWAFGHNAMHGN